MVVSGGGSPVVSMFEQQNGRRAIITRGMIFGPPFRICYISTPVDFKINAPAGKYPTSACPNSRASEKGIVIAQFGVSGRWFHDKFAHGKDHD